MEFGIGYFPTHDAVKPGPFARLVEGRGHESLVFAEHTHIPASRESGYPGWSWPKPAQKPHPPVLIGGYGPTVLDRVLAFGDAWFPSYGPPDLLERVAELRSRADREIRVMAMGVPPDLAALAALREAGFTRVARWIPSGNASVVEAALERWEAAIAQLNGEA